MKAFLWTSTHSKYTQRHYTVQDSTYVWALDIPLAVSNYLVNLFQLINASSKYIMHRLINWINNLKTLYAKHSPSEGERGE